jgi:hypothetical protein
MPLIYKYREWTNPMHLDILKSKRIYLPSPKELNDPFDCRIPISLYLLDNDAKIEKYVENYIIKSLRQLQEKKLDIDKLILTMKYELKYHKTEYIKKYNEIYQRKGDLLFGIFCGSLIWDSIQMWAYYSKNHSGFCIGFDPEKLWKYFPSARAMKVIYRKDYPKINPLVTYDADNPSLDFIDNCFKSSHSKAIGWRYEKEYRIFSTKFPDGFTKENRLIQIDNRCFSCLFVGLNFPEKDLPVIVGFADELKIPLYKITQMPDKFRLGKTRIN